MTEGISLGYENEEEAQKAYDKLLNIKKDYFEISIYFEPYPLVDLHYFIVLMAHPGFVDELENLIKTSKIDLGDVVIHPLSEVEEYIAEMEEIELSYNNIQENIPIRPITIGEDVPIVSGRKEFQMWEIYESVSRVASFKRFEDALKEHPYQLDMYLRNIKNAIEKGKVETEGAYKTGSSVPMICPLYKYEYAIMNPNVVGWDDCVLPLTWVKTEKECNNYEGEMINGTCIIPFGEADQREWDDDKFRIKEINRNFIFEMAKKWELPIIIKKDAIEVPKIYYGNKLIKWKIVKIWENSETKVYPTDYNTFDNALRDHNKYFVKYLESIKNAKDKSKDKEKDAYWAAQALKDNLPVIYPFYHSDKEKRDFYYEDFGLLPLPFVETKEECKNFGGELYKDMCIRKFSYTDAWDWYYETDSLWITPEKKGKFNNLMNTILKMVDLYDIV